MREVGHWVSGGDQQDEQSLALDSQSNGVASLPETLTPPNKQRHHVLHCGGAEPRHRPRPGIQRGIVKHLAACHGAGRSTLSAKPSCLAGRVTLPSLLRAFF
mgnify:CR=1 FL=1